MNDQRSTFQTAIAVVEALPVEEQTMLVEIINNRLTEPYWIAPGHVPLTTVIGSYSSLYRL